MWDRLLLAIDQFDSGQAALDFTTGFAAASGADVRVFHARELSTCTRVPPLETAADARFIVDEAVFRLRLASIGAEGRACSAREEQVASRIVDEASRKWRSTGTRHSSPWWTNRATITEVLSAIPRWPSWRAGSARPALSFRRLWCWAAMRSSRDSRSEEHTSEL